MGVKVTGLRETQQSLNGFADKVRERAVVHAVRDGANVIKDAMRESAGTLNKTVVRTASSNALTPGALAQDIKVRVKVDKTDIAVAIIGPVKYSHVARWVEFGHRMVKGGYSKVAGDGTTRGPGRESGEPVPAYPFLRPAFERSSTAALERFTGSMQTYFPEALR